VLLFAAAVPRRPGPDLRAEDVQATVTVERAELLEGPSSAARVLGRLGRGARVRVLSDQGRWFEVRTIKKEQGFAPVEALELDSDRESREKRAETILSFRPAFAVVAEDTEVLLAPYPLASRAGTLRKGSVIGIHSVDHAYFAFRQEDGSIAFVNSADVDLVPPDPRKPAIVSAKAKALKNLTVTDLPLPEEAVEETVPEPGQTEPDPEAAEPAPVELPEEPEADLLAAAVVLSKVDPVYPESARRAGISGTVVLDVAIDEAGHVSDAQVVRGLPFGLSEAAVEAVRRWHYRPAQGREGPVRSRRIVRILFRLS
jgi:TonB family protein